MKTTIELPDELFRKAKAYAALRGQSMKDLITRSLLRELGASYEPGNGKDLHRVADDFSRELEALAEQVAKEWNSGLSAAEAIAEQRRG